MSSHFRRVVCAVLLAAAMTGGSTALWAASPDFYGIKMNSENHARDLAPDELALFPVRRGFDKNIYAYAHLDTNFNHTRSITFDIFNNTDNDLLVEKSFREYYVVLRNGERYRLNEPGLMMGGKDQIDARSSGTLKADFGDLNVTKEMIEMVVCSFDMGKFKIVLLPIAVDAPPALTAKEAERLSSPRPEKEPAGVYAKDQVEPRIRGENAVKPAAESKGGRFPAMDLPIFSWLKNASTRPHAELKEIKPVPVKEPAATAAAPSKTSVTAKSSNAPAPIDIRPIPDAGSAEAAKPAPRKGLFASIFSMFSPDQKRSPAPAAAKKSAERPAARASSSKNLASVDKEFFWKPRDLAPIQPIDQYSKKGGARREEEPAPVLKKIITKNAEPIEEIPGDKPFYMRRMLDDSVRIPADEPVTAVSGMKSKTKAPVLKPQKKLRRVGPRTDAKIAQVNRQMGFIIVNAGAADGLKENMVLNVYRGGKVIAKAVVRKINEDASAALLMKDWARADVAVGDPVSFY